MCSVSTGVLAALGVATGQVEIALPAAILSSVAVGMNLRNQIAERQCSGDSVSCGRQRGEERVTAIDPVGVVFRPRSTMPSRAGRRLRVVHVLSVVMPSLE